MEFTREELEKKYKGLPEELRKALDSTEVYDALRTIVAKHGLHIDQSAVLEDEISLVLLGIVSAYDFTKRIKEGLGLSLTETENIVRDVNEVIFKKYREHLMMPMEPVASVGEEENLNREEILKEIENPDYDKKPDLSEKREAAPERGAPAPDAPRSDAPDNLPTGESQESVLKPAEPSEEKPKGMFESKLTSPAVSEKEKTSIEDTEKRRPSDGRGVDPYREPAM